MCVAISGGLIMLFLLLISIAPLVIAKNELYMGYKVYNVKFSSQQEQDNLHLLKSDKIDYLIKPNFKYDVTGLAMLPPSEFDWFEERLEKLNIAVNVSIEDVYEYLLEKQSEKKIRVAGRNDINETEESNEDNGNGGDTDQNDGTTSEENNVTEEDNRTEETQENNVTEESEENHVTEEDNETEESEEEEEIVFGYDDYYRYNEILNHIYKLRDAYENSVTTSIQIVQYGVTDQNRPLVYLKLSSGDANNNKPVVVIEGGINPREWITIPSALKIIDEVLESQQSRYLVNFDWIVVPVVNPDGYEYTHTDLRFWEKNLSTKSNLGFICPGVNINRNFNIDWSRSDSSSSACSHLYAGVDAVSEIETQFIQNIVDTYKHRISLYISLQNGGGFISYPWQYEFAASGTFRQNHLLGMEMVAAMRDDYNLDVASVLFGDRASGTSSDYARINDIPYALNIDIVRRGSDGVIVPENEIVDIVDDVWRAVAVAADYLIQ